MSTTTATYTLRNRGTDLRVETWVEPEGKKRNRARLLVDGTEVDEGASDEIGHVDLGKDSGHPTRVAWWWTGRVANCVLVEPGQGEVRRRSVPYAPPSGTRAARVHAWGEAHPHLYAARHVVINVGGHDPGDPRGQRDHQGTVQRAAARARRRLAAGHPRAGVAEVPRPHPLPRAPVRVGAAAARQAARLDPRRGAGLAEVRHRLPGRGLHRGQGGTPPQAGRPGGSRGRAGGTPK